MDNNAYFNALGINPNSLEKEDNDKLREAYSRAHDIRKFEIEMYWRRSAYLWTVQAAVLAGLALIAAKFDSSSWDCLDIQQGKCFAQRMRFILIIAIWSFGAFSAYIWLLMLRGAKFWQNNWERHVDRLEDLFSGSLYKTYEVKNMIPPYSVSKLNELMAGFMLFLWLIIGLFATISFFNEVEWTVLFILFVFLFFFLTYYFDACLRMSDFGQMVTEEPKKGSKEQIIVKRSHNELAATKKRKTSDGTD